MCNKKNNLRYQEAVKVRKRSSEVGQKCGQMNAKADNKRKLKVKISANIPSQMLKEEHLLFFNNLEKMNKLREK